MTPNTRHPDGMAYNPVGAYLNRTHNPDSYGRTLVHYPCTALKDSKSLIMDDIYTVDGTILKQSFIGYFTAIISNDRDMKKYVKVNNTKPLCKWTK